MTPVDPSLTSAPATPVVRAPVRPPLLDEVEAVEAEMRHAAAHDGWYAAGRRVKDWAERLEAAAIEARERGEARG